MVSLERQEIEFNELVPEQTSKHITAVAFVSCGLCQSLTIMLIVHPFSMIVLV